MDENTKLTHVHVGVNVRINLLANPDVKSEGIVHRVLSETDDSQGIIVILENGKKGRTTQIMNSDEVRKNRFMIENQYTENKDSIAIDVMKNEVLPHTIQAFLNAEGGYLYIGINDRGETLEEKLGGLKLERQKMEESKGEKLSDEKFADYLEMEINDVLAKFLSCDVPISHLISINFPKINNVQIIEIQAKKSPSPVFFKNLGKKNTSKQFELKFNGESAGQRKLDDFYIRTGGSKKLLETQEEFYNYFKNRFQKP